MLEPGITDREYRASAFAVHYEFNDKKQHVTKKLKAFPWITGHCCIISALSATRPVSSSPETGSKKTNSLVTSQSIFTPFTAFHCHSFTVFTSQIYPNPPSPLVLVTKLVVSTDTPTNPDQIFSRACSLSLDASLCASRAFASHLERCFQLQTGARRLILVRCLQHYPT